MKTFPRQLFVVCAAAALLFTGIAVRAQNLIGTVSAGIDPNSVTVNPATNRIYVANATSNTVSVINGATNALIATVPVGNTPVALALNPVTNKIYVANEGNRGGSPLGSVSVIDGATNAVTNIPSTGYPFTLKVNSVTNRIYVGAFGVLPSLGAVAVIDGTSNSIVATVTDVSNPGALAVNPVTNKIYVANYYLVGANTSNAITVIDGATNQDSLVLLPSFASGASAIAVNPVTNQIYALCQGAPSGGFIFQIDGTLNIPAVTNYEAVGNGPYSIAVNPVTNKVYVADGNGDVYSPIPSNFQIYDVWVFNGANVTTGPGAGGAPLLLQVGSTDVNDVSTGAIEPYSMAVNPATNQIYVGTNGTTGLLTVINGANNSFATVADGELGSQTSIAVNPITNRIYVANYGGLASNGSVSVIDGTVTTTTSVPVGEFPLNMVLNPVTNKVYAVNFGNSDGFTPGTVTVTNGATHTVEATVTVGVSPDAIAVDPVTNKIYVANIGNSVYPGSVSVIDGSTDLVTSTVAVGTDPISLVVNPVSNKVFVINYGYSGPGGVSGSVSIIDGATSTVSATLATRPYDIAVNTVTNRAYFSNYDSVTVADGTTGATIATIPTHSNGSIAVNSVTNMIYVVDSDAQGQGDYDVNVINGATNAVVATPGTEFDPVHIAINPVTNKIYVVDQGTGMGGSYVTVIDGASNGSTYVVTDKIFPTTIAVNPITNKVYIGDFGSGGLGTSGPASGSFVTVIDANNGNSTADVATGVGPDAVLVNPVTDEVYVLNQGSTISGGGSLTILGDHKVVPLNTTVTPLSSDNRIASTTPTFNFAAQSLYSPIAPTPQNLYFQLDSLTGPWTVLSGSSSFSSAPTALSPGLHTLYAYAGDGQEASATQLGSPVPGAISVYEFVVTTPAASLTISSPPVPTAGTPFAVSVVALDASGNPASAYTGTVAMTSTDSAAVFQPTSGMISSVGGTFTTTLYGNPGLRNTSETITATDTVNSSLTASVSVQVLRTPAIVTVVYNQTTGYYSYDGTPKSVTATTTPYGIPVTITYNGSTTPPTTPGGYNISATVNSQIYYTSPGTGFGFFTLGQAPSPVTWATPAPIASGTALSSLQLDATSIRPGTFAYSPVAGTILPFGNQNLNVTFTPTDNVDYAQGYGATILTVNPPPPFAPLISTPPASKVVTPGGPVNFSVTATGFPAPTYQWNFNGAPIAGATGSSLNIPVAQGGVAGAYSVTVTNSQGSVTSSFALAIVTGQFSGDPSLTRPNGLATDGVSLFVGGANATASDPNRNAASHNSIFAVPLPLGSGAATSLYPAFNPNQLAEAGGSLFWIDPASGPQSATQILSAASAGGGTVNPIYTGTTANDPIVTGSGLATDGTLFYAADEVNGSVWSLNPDGSGMAQIGPNRYSGTDLNAIAVNAGTLYLADSGGSGGPPSVLSIPTTGSSFTTLASGSPLVSPSAIAVGNGLVYIADPGAGNTVWEVPVGGGAPVALLSNALGSPIAHLGGLVYANGKLYVADSGGGGIYELQVATQAAPTISSPLTASGALQTNFSYQVQTVGGLSPYSYAATNLPTGLSINPSTGLITGQPTQSGAFPVTLTITDSTNPTPQSVLGTLQLTVYALSIAGPLEATGLQNNGFNYQVQASGGSGSYSYASTGMPAGLTLDPSQGYISGVLAQTGTYDVTLTVTDTANSANTGQAILQITIEALQITSFNVATAIVNQPFSFPVSVYGGATPYTYSAEGLPAGLSIDANSGLITGTPTQTGTTNVTLTVADGSTPAFSVQKQLPITVATFGIPSPLYATGTVGTAFSFQSAAVGGTAPYTYSSTLLPSGLTLNASTGAITGTPTQAVSTIIFLTIQDSSLATNTAYSYLNITISGPSIPGAITSQPVAQAVTVGAPVNLSLVASGSSLSYQWLELAPGSSLWSPLSNGNGISGANAASLLISSASAWLNGYEFECAVDSTGPQVISNIATVTVSSTGLPGSFFGSIGSGAGGTSARAGNHTAANPGVGTNLAVEINTAGTGGTLIGYISSINAGFAANFTLSPSGSFSVKTNTLTGNGSASQTLTFNGQLSGGTISGTIVELSLPFSATLDASSGSSAADSGFYQAAANGSTGGTYSIVGTQGEVFALSVTPAGVGVGVGTVASNGSFTVQTQNGSTVAGTVNPASDSLTGTTTQSGGGVISFSGATAIPTFTINPLAQTVGNGRSVAFNAAASGSPSYQWTLNGTPITGANDPILLVSNVTTAGSYACVATNASGSTTSTAGALTVNTTSNPGHLINLSARAAVGTGNNILIGGFGVGGAGTKQLLVRGVGPALSVFFTTDLVTPQLVLLDNGGAVVATNIGWGNAPTAGASTAAEAPATMSTTLMNALGAYPYNAGSGDTAMVITMPAGNNTAQLSGVGSTTGIALCEIYDADLTTPTAHLINISARADVGTGNNILIGGFAIGGTTAETVLIRAVGPGLNDLLPGVFPLSVVLNQPVLSILDHTGAVIYSNTVWGGDATIAGTFTTTGAFSLNPAHADSVVLVTLPPGNYTAQVSGLNGGLGIALCEIYEVH